MIAMGLQLDYQIVQYTQSLQYIYIVYTCIPSIISIDACQIALQNCNAQPLSVAIKMYCNHYRCLDELCGQPGDQPTDRATHQGSKLLLVPPCTLDSFNHL